MKIAASSDLSRMLVQQRHTARARLDLDRAAQEMTTGLRTDRVKATGGDVSRLFAFDRMLARNAAHVDTIRLTELRLEVMQNTLARIQTAVEPLSVDLVSAAGTGDMTTGTIRAAASRAAFIDMVTALNVEVAGGSLFAGTETQRPALRPAEVILGAIADLVDGMTAADAAAAIAAYFEDAPPPFLTDNYLGSEDGLPAAEVGDGNRIDYALRASDPAFLRTLKGLALAAMVAEGGAFAASGKEEKVFLLGEAGRTLIDAREGLLGLRAGVGSAQERVEAALATRTAEREGIELASARVLGADPYEAGTVFQAMHAQLESVFTVTARLATLRFANFMR
jgi:flagellar hook-associated protein 3 FlgL